MPDTRTADLPELKLPQAVYVPSHHADMTADEARSCVHSINENLNNARVLLLDLYDRKGWAALGYANWRDCVEAEFQQSKSYLYRQLEAGRIEREISPIGEIGRIPEGQLRGLDLEAVRQAKDELSEDHPKQEPHYEPNEYYAEREATPEAKQENIISRAEKEIVARARAIQKRQKEKKREQRQKDLAAKGKTFKAQPVQIVGAVTIHCHDARKLAEVVEKNSVQLIVTSPNYNVGKPYGVANDAMPRDQYERMLVAILMQCFKVLVDGGRIALVVPFGVGRDPWIPFTPLVFDALRVSGFNLDAQIIWHKHTLDTSTAWGSFCLPTKPVQRDMSEAIVIAHKGKDSLDVPEGVLLEDDKGRKYSPFLTDGAEYGLLTSGMWIIPPESAERIGHPCPFPVKLAENLIRLYAYPGATILDPMCGSGTTGVASLQLGCNAVLVDIDPSYCALATERCEKARQEKEPPNLEFERNRAAQKDLIYSSPNIAAEWFDGKDGHRRIKIYRPYDNKPVIYKTDNKDHAIRVCMSVDDHGGDFGAAKKSGFKHGVEARYEKAPRATETT